jgi:hypothetical protein
VQLTVPETVVTKEPETVQLTVPETVVTKEPETVQLTVPETVVIKEPETVQLPVGSLGEDQETAIGHPSRRSVPGTRQQREPYSEVAHAGSHPQVVWPAFSSAEFAAVPAPAEPEFPSSPPIPAPKRKKSSNLVRGILIIAILPILVGLIIGANLMSGPFGGPANTTPAIPSVTALHTQLPQTTGTPLVTDTLAPGSTEGMIPSTGVWVRVSYPGTYSGLISTPGNLLEVTDTGDHFYPIPANERTVTASLEKKDDSEDQIILEVYKNGVMLKRESNITPNGIVEIQIDVTTP